MNKNFFIYLNETSTSHLFLLNKKFLQFLKKRGRVILISHHKIKDLKKISFLKGHKQLEIYYCNGRF